MPLPIPLSPTNYATLSAMITPAIFMTANGSLIISTSNRMSRIVDRIRVLNDRGDELCRGVSNVDYIDERRVHVLNQIDRLEWRADRVRFALTMLYLSFSCFIGTSLTLAVHSMFERATFAGLATGLSVFGVSLMLGACVNLVREAWAALSSNRLEVRFYRDLQKLRVADASCASGVVIRGEM